MERQTEREREGGKRGMTEEWRRVGGKREEGTVNWLEPRSQGRVAGGGVRQGGSGTAREAKTLGQS